jgi:hypothetical protein
MVSDGGGCQNGGNGNSFFPASGPIDLRQWGVKFDSSTDNSTAMAAALAWFAQGNTLLVPAGPKIALYSTPISVTMATKASNASIIGPGTDLGIIGFTGTSGIGLTITYFNDVSEQNSTHLRGFTYCTNQNGLAAGIKITIPVIPTSIIGQNDFGIAMRGCDGYGVANYFSTALTIVNAKYFNFAGLYIQGPAAVGGTGVNISGGSGGFPIFAYNFPGVIMQQLAFGITAGANVQGIAVTAGSNFTVVGTSVNQTSATNVDQLTIADSQFNCTSTCINAMGPDIFIHHNYFILSNNSISAIGLTNTNGYVVDHNTVRNASGSFTGLTGEIIVAPDAAPGHIDNNTYINVGNAHAYLTGSTAFRDFATNNTYVSSGGPILSGGDTVLLDQPLTFAQTTSCAANTSGRTQIFSDSNTVTWGATIAGSSSSTVLGMCDGTNWTVVAK